MASYDIFTPPAVSAKMRSYLPDPVERLLEPSVGTGDLLRALEGLYTHADVIDINPEYLAKVPESPRITKHCGDFLTMELPTRYDAIVLNPPYLRFQDMSMEMRAAVRAVSPLLQTGNIDLYIAFLVKCMHSLTETGRMIAIVPSTWMFNASAKRFRSWLMENRLIVAIHDYGSEKVFPGVDVYCCILVADWTPKDSYLRSGVVVPYASPSPDSTGPTLGDICEIQNGIATLCDEVFIHDAPLFAEPCWIPVLKVSKQTTRSLLFPYRDDGTILPEDEFKRLNPQTYAYLLTQKERLAMRDRGHKTYEAWYAFGRRQGLRWTPETDSVYVSTLCAPTIPTFRGPTMLFYSGLRMTPTTGTCDDIETTVREKGDTLRESCSKRSNNWINLTATSLRELPVHQSARQTE